MPFVLRIGEMNHAVYLRCWRVLRMIKRGIIQVANPVDSPGYELYLLVLPLVYDGN